MFVVFILKICAKSSCVHRRGRCYSVSWSVRRCEYHLLQAVVTTSAVADLAGAGSGPQPPRSSRSTSSSDRRLDFDLQKSTTHSAPRYNSVCPL
jgi:hypothetical protein